MCRKRTILFLCVFSVLYFTGSVFAQGGEKPSSKASIIQQENRKPGTTDWILTKVTRDDDEPYSGGWHRRKGIEGFVSQTSIRAGETCKISVSVEPADEYKIDIFRMGYYGGKGGRLVKSIGPLSGIPQPTPTDGNKNLIECHWSKEIDLKIPSDWVSGVYLGKLSTLKTNAEAYIIFIVRDDRQADLLFQCSDLTWLAYDRWPQWHSLYDSPTDPWGAAGGSASYDVGFDRPYALYWNGFPAGFEPLTNGSGDFLMTELPLAFWLEKEGYDVTYISNVDTHADGAGLLRGKVFLSVGHDEYWTQQMVDNVTRARDAGLNLAFLSGNAISGRVELLPSTDGRPNRIMRKINRFSDEENLMGVHSYGVGLADWTCVAPENWVFEGTGMKKGDRIHQLVGWEFHGPPFGNQKNMTVLAEGPVTNYSGEPTNKSYSAVIYTTEKGNYVFNAATCWWTKVLSYPPGYMNPPYRYFSETDKRVQRITKNVLDRMISAKITGVPNRK
ncbi:MAG TPA: N,N-dimethylformamidase beta subunit family domain-containing protein [Puia sp.]|nr:N,N-dimethylformamidase beta subunit family domain-containing protein [Puia sp.]